MEGNDRVGNPKEHGGDLVLESRSLRRRTVSAAKSAEAVHGSVEFPSRRWILGRGSRREFTGAAKKAVSFLCCHCCPLPWRCSRAATFDGGNSLNRASKEVGKFFGTVLDSHGSRVEHL
jgi:hypothetical protein